MAINRSLRDRQPRRRLLVLVEAAAAVQVPKRRSKLFVKRLLVVLVVEVLSVPVLVLLVSVNASTEPRSTRE